MNPERAHNPAAGTCSEDRQPASIRRAERDNLYRQVPTAVAVNIVLAGLVAWAALDVIPSSWVLSWVLLIAALNGFRAWIGYRYRGATHVVDPSPGLKAFVVLTLASGVTWGAAGPLLIARTNGLDQQLFLMVVMAGLAAGAIPFLAVILRVYIGYLAVLLGPSCLWLLLSADSRYSTVGLAGVVFAGALASAGRNYAANFRRSQMLADALCTAKARTDDANRELREQIADTMGMHEALRASERRFQTAFEQAPIGIALLDATGRLMQTNPAFAELLGYPVDELRGRPIAALVLDDDRFDFEHVLGPLLHGAENHARAELRFVRSDGETLWAALAMAAVAEVHGRGGYVILQFQDITESVRLSARLQYEAAHDDLTGFVNRREFERRLAALLATRPGRRSTHTLCYLDLDRFKLVNDSEGHVAGDEVLRQVAMIVHEHIRGGDTIARIGGDEFVVLLEHCDTEAARQIAKKLVEAIGGFRFCWNGKVFRLDVSVGVAAIEPDHRNTSDILRTADAACAAAKDAGGARAHVYSANDQEHRLRQREIEWIGTLTRALERGDFLLHAQPIVPTAGQAKAGAKLWLEVLIRMRGEAGTGGLPGAFLPAAERYGLAPRIDRWVVDQVLEWLESNPGRRENIERCAINLSGTSLGDAAFADHVVQRVRNAHVDASRLHFEITETAAIRNLGQARRFMAAVGRMGCGFALDDFGSGLSSFGYLRSLPVDALKIDGQLVCNIVDDGVDRALVKSISEAGRVLGLTTVAESVDNEAVLETLREIGVDRAQGYHIGAPRPLGDIFDAGVVSAEPPRLEWSVCPPHR